MGTHALVFGASGLAGWGVVDQLLDNYPVEGTFTKVTVLVNRPLSVADSFWPSPSSSRSKLEVVSNVNLTEGSIEEFTALLKGKVEDIAKVTHAFYFGKLVSVDKFDMRRLTGFGDDQPIKRSMMRILRSTRIVGCLSV